MLPRLQEMVLLKISLLGPCTVRDIAENLTRETSEDQAIGSIHKTATRLMDQGYVSRAVSQCEDGMYRYAITREGTMALNRSIEATCNVFAGILHRTVPPITIGSDAMGPRARTMRA